ncbi:MAG: prepilin-type N-terminal cleavage/methylation domain-containing protein [Desulfatiglans sp.]|nr:prepilin-type N-terminal cleavage/methylation domain-containing protein [Desulfatiglans sp.]
MCKYFQKINGNLSNERGFTLLEVIMAVSILTVGLLAVASMQISAMRGNSMSMTYTESTERVQDKVEKLLIQRLMDSTSELHDKAPKNGVNGLNDLGENADYTDNSNPGYTVYWNVAEDYAGGKALNGINTIRVIVTWRGGKRYSFDILKNRI